jgi:hypothetical protein
MSPVDRLFEELVKNIKKSSEYTESLERKTQHDKENLETHLTQYKEQVNQEQGN